MSTKETLLALAGRCEREEPSQELNEEIAFSVGWRLKEVMWWKAPGSKDWVMGGPVFTTSLDAAVTLVPEDWCWAAEFFTFDRRGAKASVWRDSRNPKERVFNIEALTPAMALCAAALRARAAAE